VLASFTEINWIVWTDAQGNVWAQGPSGKEDLLADADSLCGVGLLETGIDDVFRAACSWHDHGYMHRAEFEEWGFDRAWIDERFYEYMLVLAGDDLILQARARGYYELVRTFGWIFYYRHPGKEEKKMGYKITKKEKKPLAAPVLAAFNQGETPTISVVNLAKTKLPFDLELFVSAMQLALDRDFAPVWGTPAKLIISTHVIPGTWGMIFYDDADVPDALGYHDLTPDGFPVLKSFVRTDAKYHEELSVTATHELWEALVDPGVQMLAMNLRSGDLYAYESADAVERDFYIVNGFKISNFVFPSWFESFRNAKSVKFDFLGLCTKPFEIRPGGYMPVFKNGRWGQVFASLADELAFVPDEHPRYGLRANLFVQPCEGEHHEEVHEEASGIQEGGGLDSEKGGSPAKSSSGDSGGGSSKG
jgi:hypothetical protein